MGNIMTNRLDRGFERYQEEFESAALKALRSGWYILGKELENFEKNYAAFTGSRFCAGCGNGLDALTLACRAIGITKGDEVIVQGNTFIASAMGISAAGGTPVFVEPDEYYQIDADKIEEKITDKTKAILVVHLYGCAARMDKIVDICKKHNLRLVEDCAQSHGACFNGQMTGTFGDIGCFSFYPSKNMGAFGDAGAITTNDPELARLMKIYRNYGSEKRYYNMVVGANSRLDEMQAGLLRVRLSHMDEITKERTELAKNYADGICNDRVIKPAVPENATSVWHQYVLRVPSKEGMKQEAERDRFRDYLDNNGIGTIIHYPIPPHLSQAYEYLGIKQGALPITERYANEVISLPIYSGMTAEEQQRIIDCINAFE